MVKHLLILFLLGLSPVFGQNDSIPLQVDESSTLHDRVLEEDLSKKYTGEDFNYEIKTGESKNLLERFFRWLSNLIRSFVELFGDALGIDISPNTMVVLEYMIYGLMGLLIIFLLVRIFINEKFHSIFTKQAKPILDINFAEQHIESVDLDALMDAALKEKNYRLAVRYQFLKILKQLSQKEIIDWHFEKTNSDYEKEIQETTLQTEFKKASYLYEYIWYGEQHIDESGYSKTSFRFAALNNLIG